jgi:putative endonuclease
MERRSAQELGRMGEQLAVEHLLRRGFAILERNYRTRWGELDIVAFDGHTLAFCEVKSRRTRAAGGDGESFTAGGPFDAVHPRKRAQVRRIAARWISERRQRPFAPALRFDAIAVVFDERGALLRLQHLEGAF